MNILSQCTDIVHLANIRLMKRHKYLCICRQLSSEPRRKKMTDAVRFISLHNLCTRNSHKASPTAQHLQILLVTFFRQVFKQALYSCCQSELCIALLHCIVLTSLGMCVCVCVRLCAFYVLQ